MRVRSWNLELRFEDLWGTGLWPCPAVRIVGKTGVAVIVRLGTEALDLLKDLPGEGPLLPSLASVRAGDRATEFGQRCRQLGITGVTLHSYRDAMAGLDKSNDQSRTQRTDFA